MYADLINARLTQLTTERQKATDELATARQRVQYLEAILLRLDGAVTVLRELQQTATLDAQKGP